MNAAYPIALAAGIALAVQVALNAKLRVHLGAPLLVTLASFALGTVVALGVCLGLRYEWPGRAALAAAPWWSWCGCLLGIAYIATSTAVAPRIGVATTLALVVTGQVLAALVIDQLGLLGLPSRPATAWRLAGAGLVVAGVCVLACSR